MQSQRTCQEEQRGDHGVALGRSGRMARAASLALLVSVILAGLPTPAPAHADTKTRAIDIMSRSYGSFLQIKRAHERPFDWSTDGCSWTPPVWAQEQNGPCQLHDFGYRNFGKGLTLERTESRRAWIDNRLLQEMERNCSQHFWYTSCIGGGIYAMYAAVRNFSDWRD